MAGSDDFPVRLNRERPERGVVLTAKIDHGFSTGAEGAIERAVGVVAGQREILVAVLDRRAPDYDFPVRLERDGPTIVLIGAKRCLGEAVDVEGGIESAGGEGEARFEGFDAET